MNDVRDLMHYRADAEKFEAMASAWKNVAAQCAQALETLAQDPRLDFDTQQAAKRTYHTARAAHGL